MTRLTQEETELMKDALDDYARRLVEYARTGKDATKVLAKEKLTLVKHLGRKIDKCRNLTAA